MVAISPDGQVFGLTLEQIGLVHSGLQDLGSFDEASGAARDRMLKPLAAIIMRHSADLRAIPQSDTYWFEIDSLDTVRQALEHLRYDVMISRHEIEVADDVLTRIADFRRD